MALADIRVVVRGHRNRVELRIGQASAELCPLELDDLLATLLAGAAELVRVTPSAEVEAVGACSASARAVARRRLLLLIRQLARMRLPAPCNAELAARAGLADKLEARKRLAELVEAGQLRVDMVGRQRVFRLPCGAATWAPRVTEEAA